MQDIVYVAGQQILSGKVYLVKGVNTGLRHNCNFINTQNNTPNKSFTQNQTKRPVF